MDKQKKLIWIIDDHRLFGAGLEQMLLNAGDYTVNYFVHPQDASSKNADPDVILMDFYMPGVDAIAWITHFGEQYPSTPVIIISSSLNDFDKFRSYQAGVKAFYSKHTSPQKILQNIQRSLLEGESFKDLANIENLLPKGLTARQVDILIELTKGGTNKAIAKKMRISPETVKTHLASIYRAINCDSRDQAIEWARGKNLL